MDATARPPRTGPSARIAARLRGQTLRIPDLTSLFRHWPAPRRNPHYPRAAALVDASIRRIVAGGRPSVERRLRDDIALLAALWFPRAAAAQLDGLALFAVWLICWDDEVDSEEGDMAGDVGRADRWRARTVRGLARALGVEGGGDGEAGEEEVGGEGVDDADEDDALDALVADFCTRLFPTEAGVPSPSGHLRRRRLFDELSTFIHSSAVEQRLRLAGEMPSYDAYMALRRGTVGGGPLCVLVELAGDDGIADDGTSQQQQQQQQVLLPDEVLTSNSPSLRSLHGRASDLLGLLNDVLSLKKELRSGCVLGAVSALMAEDDDVSLDVSLDEVVRRVYALMKAAVGAFDEAAGMLLAEVGEGQARGARRYVDGCRAVVTGTLEFTLTSPRYNIANLRQDDGTLVIPL